MSISKKLIITVFASAVLFSLFVLIVEGLRADPAPPPTEPKAPISAETNQYRVKAHEGRIAVFLEGEAEPLYILDTPLLSELPQYDRDILTKGIIAESRAELSKILEDYDN